MKNINSFKAIHNAVEAEAERQIELIEDGEKVVQETRRWDDSKGTSYAMRSKEDAQDYKYFPEPDLPPIELSDEYVQNIKDTLPELPEAKKARYISEYGLSEYDANMICSDKTTLSFSIQRLKLQKSERFGTLDYGRFDEAYERFSNSPRKYGVPRRISRRNNQLVKQQQNFARQCKKSAQGSV